MARTKQTAEKKSDKPKFNKKAVKAVIKKATAFKDAIIADLDFVKSCGGKSSDPIAETHNLVNLLKTEIEELGNASDQDAQSDADYCLAAMERVVTGEINYDDGVDLFFYAMRDLGLKSKTLKILDDESVSDYLTGLNDEVNASEEE